MTVSLPGSKIVSLTEDVPFLNILVYADSGTGKTVFAGSDVGVLFIAPEDSGTISALRLGSTAQKWPIKKWEDLMEVADYFWNMQEKGEEIPFKWFSIDSLTAMQDMAMSYVLRETAKEKIAKDQDPTIPQIQDWQKFYIIFENMVRSFNDLNVNVLYTAISRKEEDADGNEFLIPDIRGKGYGIAMKIVSLMTCYGYMKVGIRSVVDNAGTEQENKRKIRERSIYWQDSGTIKGKDRTMALAPKTVDMTLKQIREKIEGYSVPKAPVKKAPVKVAPKPVAKTPAVNEVGEPEEVQVDNKETMEVSVEA